jgi:hypothetical protein
MFCHIKYDMLLLGCLIQVIGGRSCLRGWLSQRITTSERTLNESCAGSHQWAAGTWLNSVQGAGAGAGVTAMA